MLTLSGATRALASPRDSESTITPDEESEARAIAEQFVGRFRITNDLAPILKELSVEDYDEHLQQNIISDKLLSQEVLSQSSPREISDFYTALLNLMNLSFQQSARDADKTNRDKITLAELYPPDVVDVLKKNPELESALSELMGVKSANDEKEEPDADSTETNTETEKTESNEKEEDDGDDAPLIKHTEQLREFTADANEIVRKLQDHLATLPPKQREEATDTDSTDDESIGTPRVTILEKKYSGYPPGTRLICIKVTPISDGLTFHLCLIRVDDGRLRILAVSPVLHSD
jgi:hypothetical protein